MSQKAKKHFKTCYSVYYAEAYPFETLAEKVRLVRDETTIVDVNSFLILHGGIDISPTLYNQKKHPRTDVGMPSMRDLLEVACVKKAVKMGIPIMGICRGAQMLCALNGGSLVQHVIGHTSGQHMIKTYDGKTLNTNSVHHQMMYPWGTDYELLAWSKGVSPCYQGETATDIVFPKEAYESENSNDPIEPEIVWFPRLKGFGVQGHPEWADQLPTFQNYVTDEFLKRV